MRERSVSFVRNTLAEAIKHGEIKQELDPDSLTVMLLGSILSIYNSHLYKKIIPQKELKKITSKIWNTWETLIRRNL